eukprot:TRINITY_DN94823_c0_g1_i1.p1 TRINITY_DN94823_c0_g1~~TRINITY_DN94823_c0_g1_i1.p1  ORF type:complete len:416 (-),score=63.57 TRINITY_DN94823_c0_g1_i1:231-1478(-)
MKDSRGMMVAPHDDEEQERSSWTENGKSSELSVYCIVHSNTFTTISTVCIGIALFGHSLFNLFAVPDVPATAILDTTMMCVTAFFITEISLQLIAIPEYGGSFFFWMDVIGTASMVFEISFLFGSSGHLKMVALSNNAALTRTARAARLGTRAARFLRLVKAMGVATGGKELEDHLQHDLDGSNKISEQLALRLSERISLLTILLVCAMPLLRFDSYPQEDYSMKSWAERLETTYGVNYLIESKGESVPTDLVTFNETVTGFLNFYRDFDYYPISIVGFSEHPKAGDKVLNIPGAKRVHGIKPERNEFIVRVRVPVCLVSRPECEFTAKDEQELHAAGPGANYNANRDEAAPQKIRGELYFNFEHVVKKAAVTDMATIAAVLLVMIYFSHMVTKQLRGIQMAFIPGYDELEMEDD